MTSPAYIAAISSFLTPKSNKRSEDNHPKVTYWKPGLGTYKVRFLKMKTDDNSPILPMLHYDKPLVAKRINAPVGWGMPDPINEQYDALRKTREGWNIAKNLRPKKCYYAAVLVRGEEEKGVQVWEVKEDFVKALYNLFLSEENKTEDLLDYNTGYDFEIKVVPAMKDGKPKLWEGKPCKAVNAPVQMRKPSPLHPNKDRLQELVNSIPDYHEQQRRWVKSPEDLIEIMEQFMVNFQETTPVVASSEDKINSGGKRVNPVATPATEESDPETDAKLDDAFEGF